MLERFALLTILYYILLINSQKIPVVVAKSDLETCYGEFDNLYQRDSRALTTYTQKLLLTCVTLKICQYSYSRESLSYIESIDRSDLDTFASPDHPFIGTFTGDFSQIEGAREYTEFLQVCEDLKGTSKTVTGILDLEGTAMNDVDLDVTIYVKDIPICLPPVCEGQDVKAFSEVAGKKIIMAATLGQQEKYTNAEIDRLAGMTSTTACIFLGIKICKFEVCDEVQDCGSYQAILDGAYTDISAGWTMMKLDRNSMIAAFIIFLFIRVW